MRSLLFFGVIISTSMSFAANQMYLSSRTGKPIPPQEGCTELQPIRNAAVKADITYYQIEVDPGAGSIGIGVRPVCSVEKDFPVFNRPVSEENGCFTWEPVDIACATPGPDGTPIQVAASVFISVGEADKEYTAFLSTLGTDKFDFRNNSVKVFDPKLDKIQLNLNSSNLSDKENFREEFSVALTVEDNL